MRITYAFIQVASLLFLASCSTPPLPQATSDVALPVTTEPTFSGVFFRPAEVDQPPKAISFKAQKYPKAEWTAGIEGRAVVEFIVDEQGLPTEIQCSEASAPAFGKAACEAIASWRFTPAMKGDRVVRCRMRQVMSFTLQK